MKTIQHIIKEIVRRLSTNLFGKAILVTFILSVLIKYYPDFYPLALLRSYAIQYSILVLALLFLSVLRKHFRHILLSLFSVVLIFSVYYHEIQYEKRDTHHSPNSFTIAHFNVLILNRDYDNTIKAALATNADLLSFQEINQEWFNQLKQKLKKKYPFYKALPMDNSFGIAVFSKQQLYNTNVIFPGGVPNISGELVVQNDTVQFITSHTHSPISNSNYHKRNNQIKELARIIKKSDKPLLAIGDYNCVPWDKTMIGFKKSTGLTDSRISLCPTFPSFVRFAQIPIDYIFYSDKIKCIAFSSIRGTSSDHYGIVGKYSLENNTMISELTK